MNINFQIHLLQQLVLPGAVVPFGQLHVIGFTPNWVNRFANNFAFFAQYLFFQRKFCEVLAEGGCTD